MPVSRPIPPHLSSEWSHINTVDTSYINHEPHLVHSTDISRHHHYQNNNKTIKVPVVKTRTIETTVTGTEKKFVRVKTSSTRATANSNSDNESDGEESKEQMTSYYNNSNNNNSFNRTHQPLLSRASSNNLDSTMSSTIKSSPSSSSSSSSSPDSVDNYSSSTSNIHDSLARYNPRASLGYSTSKTNQRSEIVYVPNEHLPPPPFKSQTFHIKPNDSTHHNKYNHNNYNIETINTTINVNQISPLSVCFDDFGFFAENLIELPRFAPVPEPDRGVRVKHIISGSRAFDAGLLVNDIILFGHNREIVNIDDLSCVLKKIPGKIQLIVKRENKGQQKQQQVIVTLDTR